eukprot:c876_g1_i1.p1 GENE.c876_g1_i1~~c876_g1_i1.p1  ORF type:complete len:258 (-),score=81.46 c876_g1_i1:12-713(-)
MVKAYLRYKPTDEVGVIHSPNSTIAVTVDGSTCYTACLEHVGVWNLRRGIEVGRLRVSVGYEDRHTITHITLSHNQSLLATGLNNGSVTVFRTNMRDEKCVLSGHTSAISAMAFDMQDVLLVTGSHDTDIIVWDLVAESGLFRLCGHKDQVTDLQILDASRRIISSSKDKLVKIWDMDTQHCIHTVSAHTEEVWGCGVGYGGSLIATAIPGPIINLWQLVNAKQGAGPNAPKL